MTDAFDRAVIRGELDQDSGELGGWRMSFWIHTTAYAAVNLMLIAIWALAGAGFPWFLFPLLGWGVGLAVHGAVYRVKFTNYWERVAMLRTGLTE